MPSALKKLPASAPWPRPRSTRERRSVRFGLPVRHLIMPGLEVARATPRRRETVTAFLRRTGWATRDRNYGWQFRKGLPTILEINGEAVLRKDWRRRRLGAHADVRFVSYPLGGGNGGAKQVIGLVALIAVSAFALWAGPALFGAGLAGTLGTAAIGIGGTLLVNALVGPKAGATNAPAATQDQIYTAAAQGNVARLGQPLPVWYGRLKRFPDFAATPWGEFVGNDQYLNVLLSVSMGSVSYEALFLDDTVFWDQVNGISAAFPGAQLAFYEPGQAVTLFPTNVASSTEVSGQQLPDGSGTAGGAFVPATARTSGEFIGPFAANPPGTLAQSLAIDFVMPSGCITFNQQSDGAKFGPGFFPGCFPTGRPIRSAIAARSMSALAATRFGFGGTMRPTAPIAARTPSFGPGFARSCKVTTRSPMSRPLRSGCWPRSRRRAHTSSACWRRASCRSGTARPST
jgi:hypothetical protein